MSLAKTEKTNLKRRMVSVSWLICQQSLIPGIIAIALLFSGEEGYGKYLDLYANHTAYNNLKNIGKRPGYLQYLDVLLAAQTGPVHSDLPKETRLTKDFETYAICFWYVGVFHAYSQAVSYIKDLHSYLLSFTKKTQPLEDVETRQRKTAIEFETKWEANEILGWEDPSESKKQGNGTETGGVWCSACEFLSLPLSSLAMVPMHAFRPKAVFKADCVRCTSYVQKAHQSCCKTSIFRRTCCEP